MKNKEKKKSIVKKYMAIWIVMILLFADVLTVTAAEETINCPQEQEILTEEMLPQEEVLEEIPSEVIVERRVPRIEAPNVVPSTNGKNTWQIVSEQYSGNSQSNKVGYDLDSDQRNDIFYQKNVIPTDIENEFKVYMSVSKRMTWDALLAESNLYIAVTNQYHDKEGLILDEIKSTGSSLTPGTSGEIKYKATVKLLRNGNVIHSYTGWYSGVAPKASKGTGIIELKTINRFLIVSSSVNLKSDGTGSGNSLTFNIDLDTMMNQNILFAVGDSVADSIVDTMGDYITFEKIENIDGTYHYEDASKTLTWNPVSNGATGEQVIENGVLTGYQYNLHQLVYSVHLNAEQEGFHSCASNMGSVVGEKESYPVNNKAVLNCHMEHTSYTGKPEFPVPHVRGLLYDMKFQKLLEGSKIPLSGIKFEIKRVSGGNTHAEKVEYTKTEITDSDGWIKFHRAPWGKYEIWETELSAADPFQRNFLQGPFPRLIATIDIGEVINPEALINSTEDSNNKLFVFNNGVLENPPHRAKITITKQMKFFDKMQPELKGQKYSIHTKSDNCYLKPELTDTVLNVVNKEATLGHAESVTYDLIVPESGGIVTVQEIIPESIKEKIIFNSVEILENQGSTAKGSVNAIEKGSQITVMPGNDLTINIFNVPVGKIRIRKIIDNFRSELENDFFIIQAESTGNQKEKIQTETVLAHNEISAFIPVTEPVEIQITEILPKEYSLAKLEVTGGGTLTGNKVEVTPGEEIVITVHNTFKEKPFFHVSNQIKNIFKWK